LTDAGVLRLAVPCGLMLLTMGAMAPAGPAPKNASPMALRSMTKGHWELKERSRIKTERQPKRLCIGDPGQLLQLQHPGVGCQYYVVSDTGNHSIVTYQCRGQGSGRTDVRVETPQLVQVDTQGIANGAPFAYSYEGRRIGDCP
jgi:hypothetical protein